MRGSPTHRFISRFRSLVICLPLIARRIQYNSMQNKKLVQVVIWIVVIGMVLSLAIAAISIF